MDCCAEIQHYDEETVVSTFRSALPRDSKLRESLILHPVFDVQDLQERIRQYVKLDEDQKPSKERRSLSPQHRSDVSNKRKEGRPRNRGLPPFSELKAVSTVFKEPIYRILPQIKEKPFFSWPSKWSGDPKDH